MLQRGRSTGHLPSFFVPGDLTAQESPPPFFASIREKNANARGSARVSPGQPGGEGGRGGVQGAAGIDWCIKGVNYFPSWANDQFEKDVTDKRLVNSVKYHYLSLRLVWSLFTCKEVWKQMKKEAQGTKKVVEGSNEYDWPCFLFANAMTVLSVDFEMACWSARSG